MHREVKADKAQAVRHENEWARALHYADRLNQARAKAAKAQEKAAVKAAAKEVIKRVKREALKGKGKKVQRKVKMMKPQVSSSGGSSSSFPKKERCVCHVYTTNLCRLGKVYFPLYVSFFVILKFDPTTIDVYVPRRQLEITRLMIMKVDGSDLCRIFDLPASSLPWTHG